MQLDLFDTLTFLLYLLYIGSVLYHIIILYYVYKSNDMEHHLYPIKKFIKRIACENYNCYVVLMFLFILLYVLIGHMFTTIGIIIFVPLWLIIVWPVLAIIKICKMCNKHLFSVQGFNDVVLDL